jgi:hypothetical protein
MRKYSVELTVTTDHIPDGIADADVIEVLKRDIQNHIMSLHSIAKGAHFHKYINRDEMNIWVIRSKDEPPF